MAQNRWQTYCPGCGRFLLQEPASSGRLPCSDCGFPIDYLLLPAANRPQAPAAAPSRTEGDSACFNHPHKRAERECSVCGKYLCTLCAVNFGSSHICPECLLASKRNANAASSVPKALGDAFVQSRFVPGQLALFLAVLSTLFLFLAFVTVPVAITLAVMEITRTRSLVKAYRVEAVVALLLSVGQAVFWVFALAG